MRAVIVENPGDVDALNFGEAETPTPGPGEVLVRTVALMRVSVPTSAKELLGLMKDAEPSSYDLLP